MACERFEKELAAYADFEVTEEERLRIEEHLAVCRDCRETVRDLEVTRGVMAQWKPGTPSAEFAAKVKEGLREAKREERRARMVVTEVEREAARSNTVMVAGERRRFWTAGRMMAAATVLAAAGVGMMLWTRGTQGPSGTTPMTTQTLRELVTAARVEELPQVTVVVDAVAGEQMRLERPRAKEVIGTGTVQLMLDLARTEAQGKQIGILLQNGRGSGQAGMGWDWRRGLNEELAGWSVRGGRAYAEELRQAGRTLEEAMTLERQGKYEEALAAYDAVAGSTHERVVAQVRKAGVLLRLGRAEEAQRAMEDAARAGRSGRGGAFQEKFLERMRTRVKSARLIAKETEGLERKLSGDPGDGETARKLAAARLGAGDFAGAARGLGRLAEGAPEKERPTLRFREAWCLKNSGEYERAFAELESVLADGSIEKETRVLCLFERSDILERWGRYREASDEETVLIGYPGYLDDGSRALVVLKMGYMQYYEQHDIESAKKTLARLEEPRYAQTAAAAAGREILADELK